MHGYEIAKRVEQETAGVLKFDVASLYPLLYRMEKLGWVSAEWRDSDTGRRRRCYKLTKEGKKQLVPASPAVAEFLHRPRAPWRIRQYSRGGHGMSDFERDLRTHLSDLRISESRT